MVNVLLLYLHLAWRPKGLTDSPAAQFPHESVGDGAGSRQLVVLK